jgi:hypothetical protein
MVDNYLVRDETKIIIQTPLIFTIIKSQNTTITAKTYYDFSIISPYNFNERVKYAT